MPTAYLKRIITHTLILSGIVILSFFLTQTENLSGFSLQLTSLLVIVYFIGQFIFKKGKEGILKYKILFDVTIISAVIFLIVFSTGTLYSPVFFLIYFLLFGVSLLFEPETAITLSLVSGIVFLFTPRKEFVNEILQLTSLVIIAPLAVIFGKQYIKLLQSQSKIKILETEGEILQQEVKRQEEEVKLWTYGTLSRKLVEIQARIKSILTDPNVPLNEKHKLKEIFFQIYQVFVSGKDMEKKVEE